MLIKNRSVGTGGKKCRLMIGRKKDSKEMFIRKLQIDAKKLRGIEGEGRNG